MILRRAGAPRLIEWTGERCVPWAPDVQVVYEHFHRYMWAASFLAGRRILDLASGEGFGGAILAANASAVTGIDLDQRAVEHAQLKYGCERLRFAVGDARDLSAFTDGAFDAVVAFEMIEHLSEQAQVLAEIRRVLAEDGLLVISTPDRRRDVAAENPFHERELDRAEFTELLGREFAHVELWGQRVVAGSLLSSGTNDGSQMLFTRRSAGEWDAVEAPAPVFHVAVASPARLPPIAATSVLADPALEIVSEATRQHLDPVRSELERRGAEIARLAAELEAHVDIAAAAVAERDRALAAREAAEHAERAEAARLSAELAEERERSAARTAELTVTRERLARIEASIAWRALRRVARAVPGRRSAR